MKRSALVLSAFLCALLVQTLASNATAAVIQFTSLSGNWHDPTDDTAGVQAGDPAIVNGVPTSTMSWGTVAAGDPQSSYVFDRSIPGAQTLPPAPTPFFPLGTFTHNNFPINPPSLTSVKLDIVVNMTVDGTPTGPLAFTFQFTHVETPNNIENAQHTVCPYYTPVGEGCTDKVSFVSSPAPTTFNVGGINYTLTMSFVDDAGNPVTQFITRENLANTANLVGQFDLPASSGATVIQLNPTSYSVNEGAGKASVTVTRTGDHSGTSTVQYGTSNGSATSGQDYTSVSGTLTFNPGDTVKSIDIPVIDDSLVESNENFFLTISNPTGASLGAGQATITIIDNDVTPPPPPPPSAQVQFNPTSYSANEGDGLATITVTRTVDTTGTSTVQFASSNGTATAGQDYVSVSGTLTFNPGDTTKTFDVPLIDDNLVEGNETVLLTLSNPSGATLGASQATLTIVDNDTVPPPPPPSTTPFINELVPYTAPVDFVPSFTVRVLGSGFNATSAQVIWNGATSLPVVSRSTSEIDVTVNPSIWSNTAGSYPVIVRNPGNIDSNAALFDVRALGTGNPPPFIKTGPAANPNPTYTKTTTLTALGGTLTPGASITYTWMLSGNNPASNVSFSNNGTPAGTTSVATFPMAGTYHILVRVTDSVTMFSVDSAAIDVVVIRNATSLSVTPKNQIIDVNMPLNLTATIVDQWGLSMTLATSWSSTAGSLAPSGQSASFSASDASIQQAIVTASATNALNQALSDTAKVTIVIGGAGGLGDLSLAKAYPVPFKGNNPDQYIHFRNLPDGTKIRIFTITGHIVQTLIAPAGGQIDWDVKNANLDKLASGVYLYIMEGAGHKKEGKLVIIQ